VCEILHLKSYSTIMAKKLLHNRYKTSFSLDEREVNKNGPFYSYQNSPISSFTSFFKDRFNTGGTNVMIKKEPIYECSNKGADKGDVNMNQNKDIKIKIEIVDSIPPLNAPKEVRDSKEKSRKLNTSANFKKETSSENQKIYLTRKSVSSITKKKHVSKCTECHKCFQFKTDMYKHKLTHFIKNFNELDCPVCKKTYRTLGSLKNHMKRLHEGEDKEFCPICPGGKSFDKSDDLLVHISTNHFISNQYESHIYHCEPCKKSFTSKHQLGKHMSDIHVPITKGSKRNLFTCENCDNSFEKLFQLRHHVKGKHMKM